MENSATQSSNTSLPVSINRFYNNTLRNASIERFKDSIRLSFP